MGQFAAPKREMLLVEVQSTDAFFQREETFIDFSAVDPRLLVLVDSVGAAL